MAQASPIASPILFQNTERTVTLIDVPRSIAAAQGTAERPCHDTLLSSVPLEQPFPINEPVSKAAKSKLRNNTVDDTVHGEYVELIEAALAEIRTDRVDAWCLPRPFVEGREEAMTKKRRLMDEAVLQHDSPCIIRLPPASSYMLGDCNSSHGFHAAVRADAEAKGTRRSFDFMLFDPPWPNRSVRRTTKSGAGAAYNTLDSLAQMRELLLDMNLHVLMAEDCLVGVWITNKAAIRDLLLGEQGLFACWGVELVEEWIWLKTTVRGEPVTPLDSAWRKPYETLLVGRKRKRRNTATDGRNAGEEGLLVQRRVLVSVPDLHSRKPCLKEMIEPMMPNTTDYRALEVFARYLVVAWWSWGDECTRFNHSDHWQKAIA